MVWPLERPCLEIPWSFLGRPGLSVATAASSMEPIIAEANIVKAEMTISIAATAASAQAATIEIVIIITMPDIAAPSTLAKANYSTATTTVSKSAAS